jgi:hypothetical protein
VGGIGSAEAVVDPDHRDPWRTRGQHRQQRGHALERRAVPRRGWNGDDRCGDESGQDRHQRRLHAGHGDHEVGGAQLRQHAGQPVQPGHAHVEPDLGDVPERGEGEATLLDHRPVRRPAGDDQDVGRGARTGSPHQRGPAVLLRFEDQERLHLVARRTGRNDRIARPGEQFTDDGDVLLDALRSAVHRLGKIGALRPLKIQQPRILRHARASAADAPSASRSMEAFRLPERRPARSSVA